MNLHTEPKLFSDTLRAASQHLSIKLEFVEKDYWITLLLHRLAISKFVPVTVFKGGTSLSKGYQLINRFSEDVDLAVLNSENISGNEIKKLLRSVEKEITRDLREITIEGFTSKGSKFRKSAFEYNSIDQLNSNGRIIVEINSFENTFSFAKLPVQSLVYDFLVRSGNKQYVIPYGLAPVEINIQSKERTLLEKIVSLIRFSFDKNYIEALSAKIRHFYDIHFLLQDKECILYITSDAFTEELNKLLTHDKASFDEPAGWTDKSPADSPLINNFAQIWLALKNRYESELSGLAYRPIPDENEVAKSFNEIISRLR